MHPTLAAFAASYRHRYPDLVVKTDEDFDLVIEWQQGAESPCHEVYVRIVQDGLRIVLDCDGGHSLTFDEERPTDSLTDAFIRNGAAPILAAPGTFGALVLERCLFRDSAIRPQSPDRLN